ncbi:MAG: hypothetical protein PVJ98_04675 [Akkermansiaceae bacterium]|jgi:hypothetical protein
MTALLALLLKLQVNFATASSFFFFMVFGGMKADFGPEVAPLPPLEEAAPAKPAPKPQEPAEKE